MAAALILVGRARAASPDADYLAGLTALDEGRWEEAAAAFAAASAASSEDVRYLLALGVAQLLGERPGPALETLRRANRLSGGTDRAVRMWVSAAQCMGGDFEQASRTGGFDFRDPFDKQVYDAFRTYGNSVFQERNGVEAAQLAQWKSEGLALFPAVGCAFSRRSKAAASGAFRNALIARAVGLLKEGRADDALTAIEEALPSSPDDPYAEWLHGEILLRCGAPEAARAVLTDVLTVAPDAQAAYLGRAHALALLGDAKGAWRDLTHAREGSAGDPRLRLDGGAAVRREAIEALLSADVGDATALARCLPEKALGDWQSAVGAAMRVMRAADAARLRFDEGYQEGLRPLAMTTLNRPSDPDAWVALAEYLDRNRDVWATAVEPRAPLRPFRTYRRNFELDRIIEAADKALARKPGHPGALTVRASALIARGDYAGAQELLREALEGHPPVRAYELMSGLLSRSAAARRAEAAALRSPRTETSHETRPDGEYTVTRTYPPGPADLARAAELEAEARRIEAEAAEYEKRFLAAARGTPDEIFYRACRAWAQGDRATALALMQDLTRPKRSEARYHWQLLEWMRAGDATAYDEQFSASACRYHSTAAGMLRIAWRAAARGAYDTAAAALDRAAALDPADARTLAYSGLAAEEQEQLERAVALYRAGLAMEEARLRLLGRGLDNGQVRLAAADWPLSAGIGLRLSALLSRAGRGRDALEVLDRLLRGLRGRVDLPDPMVTSPEAMALPEGQLPAGMDSAGAGLVPPSASALLAWLQIAAADIHRRAGRKQEAGTAYGAALALPNKEVRPLASYNRDEKALIATALDAVPMQALARFDMAETVAQLGAIECGAIKSERQIHEEDLAAREQRYKAAGDVEREYARRSLELNADFARKRRGVNRFDQASLQALQAEHAMRQKELQDWREQELDKLNGMSRP